jgi:hypothetical protein
MLEPFRRNVETDNLLTERYPSPKDFAKGVQAALPGVREGILRGIITEGIPFAFRDRPTLYEEIRDFLARRLDVSPKNIALVGSARLGYSLSPIGYGKPFTAGSDLDFSAISEMLFLRVVDAFHQWEADLATGRETLTDARELRFWKDNLQKVPWNVRRGFIDPYKVPLRYKVVQDVENSLWLVKEKLARTPPPVTIKRASLRVYRNWEAYARQQELNLTQLVRRGLESLVQSS